MKTFLYSNDEFETGLFKSKSFRTAKESVVKVLRGEKEWLNKFKKNPKKYLQIITKKDLVQIKKNYDALMS